LTDAGSLAKARRRHADLLDVGVTFPRVPAGTLPWLMAVEPFTLDAVLTSRVQRLGSAMVAYVDAVQRLYAAGNPVVRHHLDLGTEPDLRGLQLDRHIQTFRLDLVLSDGRPVATELEEVYGNAGKAYAMQLAYGTSYHELFASFATLRLSHILVDDGVQGYGSELALLRRALRRLHGQDVAVRFFSEVDPADVTAAWRFCYTTDLGQYDRRRRAQIVEADTRYINPLFHGYGTKAQLALAWHPEVAAAMEAELDAETWAVVRAGIVEGQLLTGAEDDERLVAERRMLVIKVTSSPADRSATWGSRGVYFGESSARKWATVLAGVRGGHLPGHPASPARFLVNRLVESDRFDVIYFDPELERLSVMKRARIRIAPIFFRTGDHVRLVAGHATFVNTSRKVHLGRHAVCAPLDWARDEPTVVDEIEACQRP
jgi:hypothetical protein